MRRSRVVRAALAVSFAAVLAGCGGPAPGASPTASAPPAPSPSPSPSVTVSPPPAPVALPVDCAAVGSAATRAATVDLMTEYGDAAEFERPAPPDAVLALGCNWIEGDATGYLLLISQADAGAAQDHAEATLPGAGFSCQVGDVGAYICTQTLTGTVEPVDTIETIYVRDGVWIYQSATNTDGDALLTDLVAGIWPA
ncbi:hypothetical protein AB0N73_15975 [Microbacterium sp. NPDC089189]|uniref:hypothetical protein n=1 Tax=Microbacterium sp. NPDC089189 TaxID=3154972 RepID=UPI00344073A2